MIGWLAREMWRRLSVVVVAAVVAGCWSDDDQINGFTPDQWAQLKKELSVPAVDGCMLLNLDPTQQPASCGSLAAFGQQLFNDPALSSRDMNTPMPVAGAVSCATCHEATKWFIDPRTPNNVSKGATVPASTGTGTVTKWTARNSMATVDMALKYYLETQNGGSGAFTWTGKFKTPGAVLELAIAKPFANTTSDVATVARNKYAAQLGTACSLGVMVGDDQVIACLERALDAYMFQISSLNSPFDQWLAGKDDAISTAAKRGFQVFVGRGTCMECHKGAAFSDFDYHDTGVPQTGSNAPTIDLGRSDVTHLVDDDGKFMTPSLRNLDHTGPYMHDGSFTRLEDIVEFYRHGGGDGAYSGVKDPRISPLDLTDEDVHDLVEFLQALDDPAITVAGMKVDLGSGGGGGGGGGSAGCQAPQIPCGAGCVNPIVDYGNCGACGHTCGPAQACEMDTCIPAGICQPPLAPCGTTCANLVSDPNNCGACGHVCTTPYCVDGVCG